MKGTRSTRLKFTVFSTVSLLLFVGLFRIMSNTVDGETQTWRALFTQVSGLRPGDDVRVAGVRVGRVEAVEVVDNDTAQVTFTLSRDQVVYDGTRLSLRYQNLLGQRYLAVTTPGVRGDAIGPDRPLPVTATDPGFDLTALLNGFKPLFDVLEPAAVNELATNIVAVLQGESGTIESLLRNTADATTFLADRDEVFGDVLANLNPVLANLDERGGDLDATVVQLRKLMTGLADERGTFANSIDHLGGLVESTSSLLSELRAPLARDVASLRETTALLVSVQDKVALLLERLPFAVDTFARTTSLGAHLQVYICSLGVIAGGDTLWLGDTEGPYSKGCS